VGSIVVVSLLMAMAAMAQSTNKPMLSITKIAPNSPALLQWTSRTNEVYRIDYTVGLTSWFTAAVDFSTQGTNTLWSDLGSESGASTRPSSTDAEAPYRFYRIAIQGYMTNALPVTITVSNASNGTVLTELTNILAGAESSSNVISGRLLVDGNEIGINSGTSYSFPLETRFYPNGTHRLSINVEDNGDSGTSGGDDPVPDPASGTSASYATKNISVVFSNFLSDVRLKYQGYRPDLGQTQEIYATWASAEDWEVDITPADDTNTVYRSFGGSGTSIVILWDGLDSNGQTLDPQRVAYVIRDLGASTQMQSMVAAGLTGNAASVGAIEVLPSRIDMIMPPLPWDTNSWLNVAFDAPGPLPVNRSTATWDSSTIKSLSGATISTGATRLFGTSGGGVSPMGSGSGSSLPPFMIYSPYKTFGSFGMLYQGDHPLLFPSNRPQRGAPYGQVTFASNHQPPWGGLKAARRIADSLGTGFWISGYQIQFINGDDDFKATMLQKTSLGGDNILNYVNIGLYVGHSAACKENIVALSHPQSYIPVYDSLAGTMTWVGMNDMDLGSSSLKWMAFYSCNLFRSSSYRDYGIYDVMKNNEHLAMNSSLHIMQAYATEMTVRHDMGQFWTKALINATGFDSDSTVLGAWKYVCLNTQPRESSSNANVSRSAYWPECAGDHIYGYGSQTDPDPNNVQGSDLQEDDQMANTAP